MNASSSMHSRLAVRQELGSDVGSASITPIDPTRPSAAERPTRSMLGRQTRRNWRRNRTQNPPYPSRRTVPQSGTTSKRFPKFAEVIKTHPTVQNWLQQIGSDQAGSSE